jgi:hypothetical protein
MAERQTATEWILNQYAKNSFLSLNDFREASRMEKEEIMDAYAQGTADEAGEIIDATKDAEQYYNETYGGKD